MGSRRLITVLLVCLFINNDIRNTQANVGNHQEERHEYQYQRSSKVVGGAGYYNSRSGNVEEAAGNFDGWTQSQRDQVEGMAEKLRAELSTAQPAYGERCSKICAIIPGFVGRSQEEIDQIAKDMTSQIILDLQSGKIVRSQMNQPNWFEDQVAQKILELRNHHQQQYQQNVFRATSRFNENQGSQVQPHIYAGGRTYNKETEDVQQQQENVFSDDDLRQVQQSVFDQRQQQQQGNFYQQQSQNQQHTVYTRPVHRYYGSQTTNRDFTNEQRFRTVYPTPTVMTNSVKEERNFTSSSSTASVPQINVYNQYGSTDKEMEDREYTRTQTLPTEIPGYNRSYYAQKEFEERHRNAYRPVVYPTSQTIQTSQTTSEREHTMPVVIPTQRTTTTNVHVEQEEKEVRRQPQLPVFNYGHEENTEERETTYHRNRPNIVPPTRRTSYEIHNTEQEQKVVEVHTPSPVPATSNKHSIYSHVEESEVVPNYQPRVVIDKNTEFEILDHRRDYRPQVPSTRTHTTIHESEQEEHRRHRIPVTPATPQTTYREDRNDVEVTQVVEQVTSRYQPSTSQHVITEETEETRTHHRPRPYPVYTNHGQTIERNQTSTSTSFRRPTHPIYPTFITNATTFENGDTYIRHESHIPTTYIIEMTVEEYEERLHLLRNELSQLGYSRLTDEEYNATIAAGGFIHNGYTYIYNGDSGRFQKNSTVEVNNEEYEAIFETLQHKLREIGFGEMCQQEVQQAINTGVFIRNGNKFVYDSARDQYEQIRITKEERREIFTRIQELLRRLGYRLLTQKENEGVLINGHFIRAAHQWIYNIVDGTVVKTIFVGDFAEFTDDEYREIYQKIQDTLRRIGYTEMSESQCNATIASGTFERGGIYWSYNPNNGEFERILLSQEEYRDRVQILRDELRRLGHKELSEEEFRKIIYQGYFLHGGYRYEYIRELRRYEKSEAELTAEEYRDRLRQLQDQLIRIGYDEMSEWECNSTITSGTFERGGISWIYNADNREFEVVRLSPEEYRYRVQILRDELRRAGHRELSAEELRKIIYQGYFYHGGYRYEYVKELRRYEKHEIKLTVEEYRERLRQLQDQLIRIGYEEMSESECNSTITSGTFERGGISWVYNSNNREFEVVLLSQEEYRYRVQILRDELRRLGHRELSGEELRKIIYQGFFYHGGYRYEYVKELRRYERVELTAEEYRERLRQLREQLIRIGYGTMNEAECNSTISTGKFYYRESVWVYNSETRDYRRKHDSTKPEEPPVSPTDGNSHERRPRPGIISKNRGDQPPQHFEEDYESDEILEEEPGMGYYPTGKKPEVGLGTPEPMDQIRETTPLPTDRPQPTYVVPSDYQRDRYRHEQQLTTQMWPTQPATISERRYHRKQTTYTQTTGVQPQAFATQRAMRHVPGNEFGEENELEETSTPFEPLVVSTQAYLVGNEQSRPYNPHERPRPYYPDGQPKSYSADDQNEIIERYLRNERHPSPAVYENDSNSYQQQEDPKPENIEDLGQQFEDFDGQHEEDVQQQLIDLDTEAEDLRQQQVDVNGDEDRNGQQKLLDGYAEESDRTEYNSHYHGQKETANEYEAEVVQVTDKAVQENEESTDGLWRRFKDKTKDIFG